MSKKLLILFCTIFLFLGSSGNDPAGNFYLNRNINI